MTPSKIAIAVTCLVIGIPVLLVAGLILKGCNAATGYAGKAIDVVAAQLDPATLLRKYEWFKDAAAQCDRKIADISVYESRFKQTKETYGDAKSWPRDVREQMAIWQSEVAGIQASYNGLAADYNAQMSKMNYAFCNVGELPRGATTALPREFKPYQSK